MVLELKQDTPHFRALKKYEDELIDSLTNADVVALKKWAVDHNLVPGDMVSHIQSLDPSVQWPHSLIYRFLFFCVCTTKQKSRLKSRSYKKWLSLLSKLHTSEVDSVLTKVKLYISGLESIVASRASEEGDLINMSDIPLLAEVIARQSEEVWKEIVYPLHLPRSEIEMIKSLKTAIIPLEELFNKWASNIHNNFPSLTVKNLMNVLCGDVVGLKNEADQLMKQLDCKEFQRCLKESEISFIIVKEIYNRAWKLIAFALLLPESDAKQLSVMRKMEDTACLTKVLTTWVLNSDRAPTVQNFVALLDENIATRVMKDLMTQGSKSYKDKFYTAEGGEFKISPSFPLHIKEDCSALLEVEVNTLSEVFVNFKWLNNDTQVNNGSLYKICVANSYYGSNASSILVVHAKDLTTEGAYNCIAEQNSKSVESQLSYVTIITPLDECRSILTDFYTVKPEVPEDTWPPVGSNAYISLALIKQEGRSHVGKNARITIRGDVDDIYGDKENILYDSAFSNLEVGSRLIVEGRPGSGKTTLVHKVSQDWANGKLAFPHNRLLLLVHLRAFSSDPNVGLHDILKCFYDVDSVIDVVMKYAQKHNGLGLCFILDGLDEYAPNTRNSYIFKLIRKEVLPKAVVIIASRPAAAANFRSVATRQIEVIGFLKEQIHNYIDSYPFSGNSKHAELHMYLKQHPNVEHMCYLPIHAAMVCFLFDNLDVELPQTETEIYTEFTKFTLLRTLNRECQVFIKSLRDLPAPHKTYYNKVCKLAYETTASSKQVVQQDEVKSYFNVEKEKETLGLITVDKLAMKCGFQNMYTFLHLTFQEFLTACYISGLEEKEQLELIEECGGNKTFQQVWKFYCGLVEFDQQCSKFKALVNMNDYGSLYVVQCCFESQQPHLCITAVESCTLLFAEPFLSSSNFTEIAYVISHVKNNIVKKLTFQGCTFGKEEIDVLLNKAGEHIRTVTSLYYSNCSPEQLTTVSYFLQFLSLVDLDLSCNDFGVEGAVALSDGLECCPHLQKLNIDSNNIGGEGAKAIAEATVRNLTELKINSNNIGGLGAEAIVRALDCQHLEINSNNIGSSGVLAMAGALKCKHSNILRQKLRVLDISSKNFEYDGPQTLGEVLTKFSASSNGIENDSDQTIGMELLQMIDISSNNIGCEGAIALAEILRYRTHLTEVRISGNKIGIDGAKALVESLKCCSLLEVIQINSNNIDSEGARALANAMKHWSKLRVLDASTNCIGTIGIMALLSACQHCPSVRVMNLNCTLKYDMDDIVYSDLFTHSLRFCGKIEKLYLDFNNIGISSSLTRNLADGLKYCCSLEELSVRSNQIHPSGAETIVQELCRHCTKLHLFDVRDNPIERADVFDPMKSLKHCTCYHELLDTSSTQASYQAKKKLSAMEVIYTVATIIASLLLYWLLG